NPTHYKETIMKKIFLSLTLGLTLAASNAAFAQKKGGECYSRDNSTYMCPAISQKDRLTIQQIYDLGWKVVGYFGTQTGRSIIIEQQ
ncbi:TPA: hypothetical protein ACGDWP_003690, partial [Acinetobacter baumannii]